MKTEIQASHESIFEADGYSPDVGLAPTLAKSLVEEDQ